MTPPLPSRRPMYWVLRGHQPVPADDLIKWALFFERIENRRVAEDTIKQPDADDVQVSTVFLGIDHQYGDGLPLLFESMVFGGPLDGEEYRYSTWNEALAGHRLLTDEAVIEGKVAAWEVRERLRILAHKEQD